MRNGSAISLQRSAFSKKRLKREGPGPNSVTGSINYIFADSLSLKAERLPLMLSDKQKKSVSKINQTGHAGQKTYEPKRLLFKER
jgi:hypothetical protein